MRNQMETRPSEVRCLMKRGSGRGLVKMSAGISEVGTQFVQKVPSEIWSRIVMGMGFPWEIFYSPTPIPTETHAHKHGHGYPIYMGVGFCGTHGFKNPCGCGLWA